MAQNDIYGLVLAVRDQLRSCITGGTGYNFNLSENQIQIGWRDPSKVVSKPGIFVGSVLEENTDLTPDSVFQCDVRIVIYGYVETNTVDEGQALLECLKLQSDIRTALMSDITIGERLGGGRIVFASGDFERVGVVVATLIGRLWV